MPSPQQAPNHQAPSTKHQAPSSSSAHRPDRPLLIAKAVSERKLEIKHLMISLFGSGSIFPMGEENIFLFDCMKNALNLLCVPIKIADLHLGNSTWFKGYDRTYFLGKGVAFTCMSDVGVHLFIIQFAFRKCNPNKIDVTFLEAISHMLAGRKQYLNERCL